MAPTALTERPAEMNALICISNINKEGFNSVSSIKTDIYFTLGFVWLAASSNLRYIIDATAGRIDQHFKTNRSTGKLIHPVPTWIDRFTRQLH